MNELDEVLQELLGVGISVLITVVMAGCVALIVWGWK